MLKVMVPRHWARLFEDAVDTDNLNVVLRDKLTRFHETRVNRDTLAMFFAYVTEQLKAEAHSDRLMPKSDFRQLLDNSSTLMSECFMAHAIALRRCADFDPQWPVIAQACSAYSQRAQAVIPFVKFLLALGFDPSAFDVNGKSAFHYIFDRKSSWNEESILFAIHLLKHGYKGYTVAPNGISAIEHLKALSVDAFHVEKGVMLQHMDFSIWTAHLIAIESDFLTFASDSV